MVGPAATTIAILAIALIGVLLLSGHLPVRRALLVVMGCFIVFSASAIAQGIMNGMVRAEPTSAVPEIDETGVTPSPRSAPVPYDPYAGAAVPVRQEQPIIH